MSEMTDLEYIDKALSEAGIDHFKFYNALNYYISINDQIVFGFGEYDDSLLELVIGDYIYSVKKEHKQYAQNIFSDWRNND